MCQYDMVNNLLLGSLLPADIESDANERSAEYDRKFSSARRSGTAKDP